MSRIDWEKYDETIQADSIPGQGNNHIKAIPCSPKMVDSLLPSIPDDNPSVSKAITQLSRQSCPTYLETKSFVTETELKPDDSSHPSG